MISSNQVLFTPIDPATSMGVISLTVPDLARSVRFYSDAIGLTILDVSESAAVLGVDDTPLLTLIHRAGSTPPSHDATGLYHVALLAPSRAALGQWLLHWLQAGFPTPGQGDHVVSEALYVSDPDGHGIEIYRDRPREEWTYVEGHIQMATEPVDLAALIAAAHATGESWTGLSSGTVLGHMHLKVGDIPLARSFYQDILGFTVMADVPGALFVSAGGYHHHIGMNTWHSRDGSPAPGQRTGLAYFTITLPSTVARDALVVQLKSTHSEYEEQDGQIMISDPWGNRLVFTVGRPYMSDISLLNSGHLRDGPVEK